MKTGGSNIDSSFPQNYQISNYGPKCNSVYLCLMKAVIATLIGHKGHKYPGFIGMKQQCSCTYSTNKAYLTKSGKSVVSPFCIRFIGHN